MVATMNDQTAAKIASAPPITPPAPADTTRMVCVAFRHSAEPSEAALSECRQHIARLVAAHDCRAVAFDLAEFATASSSLLGLIVAAVRLRVEVHVLNPSPRVREALQITRLARIVRIDPA